MSNLRSTMGSRNSLVSCNLRSPPATPSSSSTSHLVWRGKPLLCQPFLLPSPLQLLLLLHHALPTLYWVGVELLTPLWLLLLPNIKGSNPPQPPSSQASSLRSPNSPLQAF